MKINIPDLPDGEYNQTELIALILIELKKINKQLAGEALK